MKPTRLIAFLAILIILCVSHCRWASAQKGTKDIGVVKSEDVIDRPQGSASGGVTESRPSSSSRRNVTYRPTKPFRKIPPAPTMEYSQVGLTVWRLLKPADSNPVAQECEESDSSEELARKCQEGVLLQQVEASAPLKIGSMVRLGIESLTHDGFLYVVDREEFADGSYGAAQLIFPTLTTHEGNNRVRAHELVLIPIPPSCFCIRRSNTGKMQTAEVLTMIVAPTPLQLPAPLSDKAMTLSDALFKRWETQWSAPVNVLEMNGGAGLTTKSMDQAGKERPQLTQDDPLPQTIYRATITRGKALLVTVPLRFKTGR